jgi:hypothetical protein
VHLVEVDVVGAEPAKAGLDRLAHVTPRRPRAPVGAVAALHVHAVLRRHHDVVAPRAERLAEQLFACAEAVDVCCVEQGDTVVEGRVHDRPGLRRVDACAEGVAAEADHRHGQPAAAELAVAHVSSPAAGR